MRLRLPSELAQPKNITKQYWPSIGAIELPTTCTTSKNSSETQLGSTKNKKTLYQVLCFMTRSIELRFQRKTADKFSSLFCFILFSISLLSNKFIKYQPDGQVFLNISQKSFLIEGQLLLI
jgi:hypothetical protein